MVFKKLPIALDGLVCCNTADSKPHDFKIMLGRKTWSWSDASKSGFYGRNCAAVSSEDQLIDMAKETMPASSCGFFAAARLKIIRSNDSGAASHTPALCSCNPSQRAFRPNVVLNSHANGHLRLKRLPFCAGYTTRHHHVCSNMLFR